MLVRGRLRRTDVRAAFCPMHASSAAFCLTDGEPLPRSRRERTPAYVLRRMLDCLA